MSDSTGTFDSKASQRMLDDHKKAIKDMENSHREIRRDHNLRRRDLFLQGIPLLRSLFS